MTTLTDSAANVIEFNDAARKSGWGSTTDLSLPCALAKIGARILTANQLIGWAFKW